MAGTSHAAPAAPCGSKQQETGSSREHAVLLWHVRVLYMCVVLLTAGTGAALWLSFSEISMLRRDFDHEILHADRSVEFANHVYDNQGEGFGGDARGSTRGGGRQGVGGELRVTLEDAIPGDDDDAHLEENAQVDEQLLRVRRGAGRGNGGRRRKFRDGPTVYNDPKLWAKEAGSGGHDDWVWLTSYSRIPLFALQEFCAATKDYCPPGLDGSPGPPGETGKPGQIGDRGDVGPSGFPGVSGPPGTKGVKGDKGGGGLNGQDGLRVGSGPMGPPGPPGKTGPMGPPGEAGFNGTIGDRGLRGRRGKSAEDGLPGFPGPKGSKGDVGDVGARGFKGDRGDMGESANALNCSCNPGPPGPPGPLMEGMPGPPGHVGPRGPPGLKGDKGDPGNPFMAGSERRLEKVTALPTTPAPTSPPTTTPEPTLEPRESDCRIKMVGKPLFQRYTGTYWGAWMKDPKTDDPSLSARYWFTRHFTGKILYEYRNLEDFRQDRIARTYELKELYFGTGHVIYDGSFYYHRTSYNEIIRYDLRKQATVAKTSLKYGSFSGKNNYVYQTEYNYFDLAVDENGLWVMYGQEDNPMTLIVRKLNPHNLVTEKTWNITVDHRSYGNGFITCGVLYMVKNTRVKNTVIDFAYDLYSKQQINVRLKFTNPFRMNNMISYNPQEKRIYGWDRGNQLTYPLLMDPPYANALLLYN